MRRILALALVLLSQVASGALQVHTAEIAATDVSQSVEFGFGASSVLVANDDTTNEVFVKFDGTTATTSDFKLLKGESVTLDVTDSSERIDSVAVVCSSSETATVRVLATQ